MICRDLIVHDYLERNFVYCHFFCDVCPSLLEQVAQIFRTKAVVIACGYLKTPQTLKCYFMQTSRMIVLVRVLPKLHLWSSFLASLSMIRVIIEDVNPVNERSLLLLFLLFHDCYI